VAVSDGFAEHVRELLAPIGPVRIKRMFGGAGVYLDDAMFALLDDDELYIKADATTRAAFEAAGASPFRVVMKGRTETMNYWRLPEASEDPAETIRWARLGLEAALRTKRPKKPSAKAAPAAELGPGPWDEA
jgi:DNA transformation protein and related proteins